MGKNLTFLKNVYRANARQLKSVAKLLFCLTFRCNLKCKICSIWKMPLRSELSVGEIERMFRKLPNLSWLDLTGGELTLREDLIDVVRVIIGQSKNLKILHMTTNGMFPDRMVKVAQEIIRLRQSPMISISLDGPEGVHDQLRGHQGSYARGIETFKAVKRLKKGRVSISCTISALNFEYVEEFIVGLKKDLPGFTADDLHFNFYHVSGHYYGNQAMGAKGCEGVDLKHLRASLRSFKKAFSFKGFLEDRYMRYLDKHWKGEKIPFVCQALHGSVFVDAYGMVFPCLFYDRPIGKLSDNDYDIGRIIAHPEVQSLKKQIENMDCPRCWAPCEAYPTIVGNLGAFIFG
ncbi:MAG: radical SAM protein [Candidatus Omnitrophica bacterium]|nr:radical SAM protein [Candidatus Omnitrophota bacterium]